MAAVVELLRKADADEIERGHIEAITAAYQRTVEDWLATGRALIEAKNDPRLPHGTFIEMIRAKLPFGEDTAQRLMALADHPVISNTAHARYLPASWMTLYEMTKMPGPMLEAKIATGEITPKTTRKDVVSLRRGTGSTTKTKPAKVIDISGPPQIHGGKFNIPADETVSDFYRRTVDMPDKERGIGLSSFREIEAIILLADRDDLSSQDMATCKDALTVLERDRQSKNAFCLVKHIADRMWPATVSRRLYPKGYGIEHVKDVLAIVETATTSCDNLTLPYLNQEQAASVLSTVNGCIAALRRLRGRIEKEIQE